VATLGVLQFLGMRQNSTDGQTVAIVRSIAR
jgi:hypothetical protein